MKIGSILGNAGGQIAGGLLGGKKGQEVGGTIGGALGSLVPFKNGGKIGGPRGKPRVILAHSGEYVLPVGVKPTKAQKKAVADKKKKSKK
jgi:hypothetical protein